MLFLDGAYLGGPMDDLLGHSIAYRVGVGPRAVQKVFMLHTVPQQDEEPRKGVAHYAGFRCTPVSVERLTLTPQGDVHYRLKTPYRDGTPHIVLEPPDFVVRLAALVPPPRRCCYSSSASCSQSRSR